MTWLGPGSVQVRAASGWCPGSGSGSSVAFWRPNGAVSCCIYTYLHTEMLSGLSDSLVTRIYQGDRYRDILAQFPKLWFSLPLRDIIKLFIHQTFKLPCSGSAKQCVLCIRRETYSELYWGTCYLRMNLYQNKCSIIIPNETFFSAESLSKSKQQFKLDGSWRAAMVESDHQDSGHASCSPVSTPWKLHSGDGGHSGIQTLHSLRSAGCLALAKVRICRATIGETF